MTKRTTTSALGRSIRNDVVNFLKSNAEYAKNNSSTPEDGCEMIADAICYAISKAFASPLMTASFTAGVGLSAGPIIINTINASAEL